MNMELSSNLISQFVEVTNNAEQPKKEATVYGTTVVNASGTFVKLDGSDVLTPVSTTATVEDGERVTVMIKNHTAIITGNISSPSARGKDLEVTAKSLTVKIDGASDAATKAQSAANSAASAASNAASAASNAARFATDYLTLNSSGLEIGSNTLYTNVLVTPNSIDFRQGDTVLASYKSDYIYLGKENRKATIDLADGVAKLYNEDTDYDMGRLVIESEGSIKLSTMHGIYQNIFYDDSYQTSSANIHAEASAPWSQGVDANAYIHIGITNNYLNEWEGTASLRIQRNLINLMIDGYDYGSGTSAYSQMQMHQNGFVGIYGTSGELYFSDGMQIYGGDVYLDDGIDLMISNAHYVYGHNTLGYERQLIGYSSSDNTVIGKGGYDANEGTTNLYGNSLKFFVKTAGVSYKPYYEDGDSISGDWYGAGFISSSAGKVYFTIPLAKPVIGSPSVSVSSVDGLQIRQVAAAHSNEKNAGVYVYGSGASAYAKPSSYSATVSMSGNSIRITASMSNTTNALNNTPCGIAASIKITFS